MKIQKGVRWLAHILAFLASVSDLIFARPSFSESKFFFLRPNSLDELARKRLLRRLCGSKNKMQWNVDITNGRAVGLAEYVRYSEISLYRGSFPYFLPLLDRWLSLVSPRTSLFRGSLWQNYKSCSVVSARFCALIWRYVIVFSKSTQYYQLESVSVWLSTGKPR